MRIANTTKLTPEETIKQAVKTFGPQGYGLEIKEQSDTCAHCEGGGGGIEITTCNDSGITEVEIVSQGYDLQVKEFISGLAKARPTKSKK